MKARFCLCLFLFAVSFNVFANASDSNQADSVIQWGLDEFSEIGLWFEHAPNFIEKIFAYIIEYALYLKFYLALQAMDFAFGVAQSLVTNIGLDSLIRDAVESLPNDYQQSFQAFGLLKAVTMLCEAGVARFVLNFMGW